MALKACKECRKEISSDANPCPHCGKKNPHGMSAVMKYGGGFLGIMFGLPVLVGFCGAIASGNKSSNSTTSTAQAEEAPVAAQAPVAVDAMQLWRDYEANEVAADNAYKGRALAVTGVVASIDKNAFGSIIVRLATSNQFESVMATMEQSEANAAATLSKGVRVTVLCKGGTRIISSPSLDDCVFAR